MFANNKQPTCGGPVDHACMYHFLKERRACASSSARAGVLLSRKEVERANEEVKRILGDTNAKQEKPRGKYEYSPKERAQIGKYAAKNRHTKAANHFSQLLETS